jgi:hypothetical protein
MLLCLPECILEGTETANSVVQHHGLKQERKYYYIIHIIQQEVMVPDFQFITFWFTDK